MSVETATQGVAGALLASGNPWGAFATAFGGAMSAGPAGPSNAIGGQIGGTELDHSGWNVSFGDNSGIAADRTEAGEMSRYMPYLVVGAVFLLGWRYLKKK